MKRIFTIIAVALMTLSATAAKSDDPTLMTVDGRDVKLSEFEYLYHKNNTQQTQQLSPAEYLELFTVYKLKVADALRAGIDTTAAFRKEFGGYRRELAAPYMTDSTVKEQLVAEAYSRMLENVDIDHLMLPLARRELADSLHAVIAGGGDFHELARRYSVDPSVRVNGGHVGWISAGMYPIEFEEMAYATPVGSVSPVFPTAFGLHMVRVNARRSNPGEVRVRHILVPFERRRTAESDAAVKAKADSIYALLAAGADFGDLARRESGDRGSARNGGDLPWFGPGRMIPEFDKVAFELADGATSEPFASTFGYHIVNRYEGRPVAPKENMREKIERAIAADSRASRPEKARLEQFKQRYGARIVESTLAKIVLPDSTLASSRLDFIVVGDSVVSLGEFVSTTPGLDASNLSERAGERLDDVTRDYAMNRLESDNPALRNIVNEYRDGLLLFEISNRNVWDRSNKDKEGLAAYFSAHRQEYAWDKPHFKGFLISATSDSVRAEIAKYLAVNDLDPDSVSRVLRREFPRSVKVERYVVAEGDNAWVDAVAFGGKTPDVAASARWKAAFGYKWRVIDAPEEFSDVRSKVVADYQGELERKWVDELRKKYKVKIKRKYLPDVK